MAVLRQKTSSLTKHGMSGTMRWMAPELIDGEPLTKAADVYSFSMTMFEIYSGGEEPLAEISDVAVSLFLDLFVMSMVWLIASFVSVYKFARAVCDKRKRPNIPSDMDPRLSKLMISCWAHDPENRPKSFGEITVDLKKLLEEFGPGAFLPAITDLSRRVKGIERSPQAKLVEDFQNGIYWLI